MESIDLDSKKYLISYEYFSLHNLEMFFDLFIHLKITICEYGWNNFLKQNSKVVFGCYLFCFVGGGCFQEYWKFKTPKAADNSDLRKWQKWMTLTTDLTFKINIQTGIQCQIDFGEYIHKSLFGAEFLLAIF